MAAVVVSGRRTTELTDGVGGLGISGSGDEHDALLSQMHVSARFRATDLLVTVYPQLVGSGPDRRGESWELYWWSCCGSA